MTIKLSNGIRNRDCFLMKTYHNVVTCTKSLQNANAEAFALIVSGVFSRRCKPQKNVFTPRRDIMRGGCRGTQQRKTVGGVGAGAATNAAITVFVRILSQKHTRFSVS